MTRRVRRQTRVDLSSEEVARRYLLSGLATAVIVAVTIIVLSVALR